MSEIDGVSAFQAAPTRLPGLIRTRRRWVAAAASACVAVLAIGGCSAGGNAPPAGASATASSGTPPASSGARPDLLVDRSPDGPGWRSLLTADGRIVSLAGIGGAVKTAYRVADGFLAVAMTDAGLESLWFVDPDGTAHRLIDQADHVAVAPDGRRIAWRAANVLNTGVRSGANMATGSSTPAPVRGGPLAYTGAAVVLGYSETGGGIDNYDVWVPARGAYVPTWANAARVIAVYQPAADGSLLGLVQASTESRTVCLAALDPLGGLRAGRVACGPRLTVEASGLVSPDGRWLAATVLADGHPRVALLDLRRVFDAPDVTATLDAASPAAWLDATTLAVLDDADAVALARVGQSALTPVSVTGQPVGAKVLPVRRLA